MSTEISPEAFDDGAQKSKYVCALIALAHATPPPAVKPIADKILELFPKFDPATELVDDEEGGTASAFNGTTVIFNGMPEPIPPAASDEPTIKKPLSASAINSHKANWVITAFDDGLPVAAIAATAAIECCRDALAVYWPDAHHWIAPRTFVDQALKHVESRPPLELWINCRVWAAKDGRHAGFTRGLKAFGGKELEALDSPESTKTLRNRLEGLCAYAI